MSALTEIASDLPYIGDSVRFKALSVTDVSGSLITSPSAATLTLVRPDGTTAASGVSLVNDGSGNYHYDYAVDQAGVWQARFSFTASSFTGKFILSLVVLPFDSSRTG